MIGARREFLDPTEMASFNSDIIKVLANTGAYRLVQKTIDGIIESIEAGKDVELPKLIITAEKAVGEGYFANDYAKAKAIAAYEIATAVANLDTKACFMVKDSEQYIPLVAAAHEMATVAAKLSTEARDIEKGNDAVCRTPHMGDGSVGGKRELLSKPSK
jgi:methylenetetrahydromethanopterin dehydrogenase